MQSIACAGDTVRFEAMPCMLADGLVVAKNFNALVRREGAHDFRIDPRNRLEFPRPIGLVVRPGNPRGGMGFPFRGPSERPDHPIQRFRIGAYASMRRSRKNGQLRRVYSISDKSHSAISVV